MLPVADSVVTRRIAEALRRSWGAIRLYACHYSQNSKLRGLHQGGQVLTMSSGSSGNSVTVPDPSRSIFCLMRRMLSQDYVLLSAKEALKETEVSY